MASTFVVTITITENGTTLPGMPITKTLTTAESGGRSVAARASGAGFNEIQSVDELGNVNLALMQSTQAVTVRFNDQTDAGLPLKATGLVLMVDSDIPSTATNKFTVENTSGNSSDLTVVSGGT